MRFPDLASNNSDNYFLAFHCLIATLADFTGGVVSLDSTDSWTESRRRRTRLHTGSSECEPPITKPAMWRC